MNEGKIIKKCLPSCKCGRHTAAARTRGIDLARSNQGRRRTLEEIASYTRACDPGCKCGRHRGYACVPCGFQPLRNQHVSDAERIALLQVRHRRVLVIWEHQVQDGVAGLVKEALDGV